MFHSDFEKFFQVILLKSTPFAFVQPDANKIDLLELSKLECYYTLDRSLSLVPLKVLVFNSKLMSSGYSFKTCSTAFCSSCSLSCSIAAIPAPIAARPPAIAAAVSPFCAWNFGKQN